LRVLEVFQSEGGSNSIEAENFKNDLLEKMKKFKAKSTIFELNPKTKSDQVTVMKNKRKVHEDKIKKFHEKREEEEKECQVIQRAEDEVYSEEESDGEPKKKKSKKRKKKATQSVFTPSEHRDKDFYIPYQPTDKVTEDGFAINSFTRDAQQAEFSVTADSVEGQRLTKTLQRWDRKKKKMVNVEDPRTGKIRTEHGVWIAASYKTDRYAKWKERTKIDDKLEAQNDSDDDDEGAKPPSRGIHPHTHWGRHNAKTEMKKRIDPELKSKDQLLKQRLKKQKMQQREVSAKQRNDAKRKRAASKRAAKSKKK
jgi:ATP-dependent RNA helicase DDX54/DBP10